MTNTALFDEVLAINAEPIDPTKDYRSELVGEGKKFKDDAALALAVVHANRHVERLEAEQKALRNDLNSRLSLEELVTKLGTLKAPDSAPQGENDNNRDQSKPALTAEDLARIVDERVATLTETERSKSNLNLVKETLKKEWGPDYVAKMKSKASDLGVGENFLNDLAMRQPKAFLKLMEVGSTPSITNPNTSAPVRGNVVDSSKQNMSAPADPNYKGKAYYMKLHRENPTVFWNPKTQLEMNEMSMIDPEKFVAN